MWVYIHPSFRSFTVHRSDSCPRIQAQHKENQRRRVVSDSNMEEVLTELQTMQFAATAEAGDLWLHIELDDPERARGFVLQVKAVLGDRFKRLRDARIRYHDCPMSPA